MSHLNAVQRRLLGVTRITGTSRYGWWLKDGEQVNDVFLRGEPVEFTVHETPHPWLKSYPRLLEINAPPGNVNGFVIVLDDNDGYLTGGWDWSTFHSSPK